MAYPNKTTGAKPSGQINLLQSLQVASYGNNVSLLDSKEIKGGLHYIKHIGDLTDTDWDGIMPSRKQDGMMAYVHYENDGTTLRDKYYKLKPGTAGTTITDWEELSFGGSTLVINNIQTVADIAARDALTGMVNGDVTHVTDASADAAVPSGGASYIYDGSTWTRILGANGINPSDVASNTAARHQKNEDTALDASGLNITASLINTHINDINQHAPINDLAGLTNTNELWSADKIQTELNVIIADTNANSSDVATLSAALSNKVDKITGYSLIEDAEKTKIHTRNKDTAIKVSDFPDLDGSGAAITNIPELRQVFSANLDIGTIVTYVDASTDKEVKYILTANNSTDNGGSTIRPVDYATSTNEKVWEVIGLGIYGINDIADVDVSGIGVGNILVWNGTEFVIGGGFSVTDIDDLSDVDTTTTTPNTGEFLKWDGSNWVPAIIPTINAIDDIGDVDTTSAVPSVGEFLKWDGTNWVPAAIIEASGSVDEHSDVDTTTSAPTTGEFLKWNGSNWIPAAIVEANGTIDSHSDVDLSTPPGNGQILLYNSSTGKWLPSPVPFTITEISDLTDVDTSGAVSGEFLKWDGINWIPDAIPTINTINDIGDATITAATTGDIIQWNGSAWVNIPLPSSNPTSVVASAVLSTFVVSSHTTFDLSGANLAHKVIEVNMDEAFSGNLTFTNGVKGTKYTIRLTTATTAFSPTINLAATTKVRSATALIAPNNSDWTHEYHVEFDGTNYWVTPEYDQN